jgi:Ser/Thr protein kinase RdoA (MazF antagonist)
VERHEIDPGPALDALRRLGVKPSAVEQLGVAAWNAHFRLEIEGTPQHLVIYRLPDPEAIAGLQFEQRILRGLAAQGLTQIPTPLVIEGESLFPCQGGWFGVTRWVEGCRGDHDPPLTPGQRAAMARGLADLHQALSALELTLDYHPDHVFVYPLHAVLDERQRLLEAVDARVSDYGEAATQAWAGVRGELERRLTEFPRELYARVPRAIVHGDFRGLNAAFAGDELTCVLDFNCCFNETRLWDVAYTALGLGGKETIGLLTDHTLPARFLADYHAASPLSEDEWELLPHMLTVVPAKLMLAAVADWWITERADMLRSLAKGGAAEIVAAARAQENG